MKHVLKGKCAITMKAVEKVMWFRPWILLLLLLGGAARPSVQAQNVPGCDPLGRTPLVDFQLTYDVAANRYTAWYVPTDNSLHRAVTGQFTIITPNGFTTPGSSGRDASFQITNINGTWTDFVIDNEQITSAGQAALPALSGVAVHQVGMAPAGVDIDPDGAGPQTTATPVTAGVAVPLFSFPGTGCASVVRILVNGEPIRTAIMTFGSNVNNEITLQIPRAAGQPALERYCKNAPLNTVTLVLPDIQDDTQTLCATSATYSNNYFTQVLRNWNPANLSAGTSVVASANQQWGSFTVSPASLQGNVSLNASTGAYTLTYPTVGGVIQPGSLTICNTLRDNCNTGSDGACVVISWLSSGSVSIAASGPNCVSGGAASLTLSATSGFSSYSWVGVGLTASSGNPVTATLSSAGVYAYTVIATSAAGCSTTATTSYTLANRPVIASVTSTNPTSCSGTNGILTLNGLVSGETYTIGYLKNGASAVTQNLTATGSGQISLNGLTAGVYSITASAGGCTSDPVSATLNDPAPPAAPTIAVNPSGVICLGNSVILTATGAVGASFNWTGSNLSQATGSSVTAPPATAGSFVYTVSQTVAGCSSSPASVTVTVNPKPSITLSALSTTVCAGGSIGLTASPSGGLPGYTFAWSGPNFSTTSTTNTINIPNATASNSGIYSVIVTDANQCSATATTPVAVSVVNCCSLSATVATNQSTICVGGSATLTVNASGNIGALTYQWSPNGVAGNSPTATVSPTGTTTYTVVVTDAGAPNCSQMAVVTVTVNQPPVVQATVSSGTVCIGSSINLTATINTSSAGPYNFSWKGPNGYSSTQQNPIIVSAQAFHAGSYTVVVTDANGCSATATTPLALSVINCPVPCPTPLAINLVVTAAQCGSATGQITATPSNGLAPYQYVWSNGQSGQTLSGLMAGVYSVTITDANGCTGVSGSINLPGSQAPVVSLVSVSPAACGQATGAISVSASGGLPPYAYQWSNGLSGSSVSGLSTGVYTVSVSDGSGCASTLSVSVPGSSNLSLVTSSAPAACGQSSGSAGVVVSGGTAPYSYSWSTGASTASVSGLVSGAYSVTVSDAGGCVSTTVVNVNSVSGPSLTLSHVDASCNATASGSASVAVSGGSSPYSYFWSNGASGSSVSGLVAGVYSVTVVDGNGCRASGQVTIGQPSIIVVVYNPVKAVCP
ncbi:Ig-like domain-containing protein, partial [Spirosoma humi]